MSLIRTCKVLNLKSERILVEKIFTTSIDLKKVSSWVYASSLHLKTTLQQN